MAKKNTEPALHDEVITSKIYLVRGQRVMLDKDLSELYGVTTGNLNKAVKRNLLRFPGDFMFQLTGVEFKDLMFQNGISSWGGTRKLPYAFTEQGVAMLSSVLNSDQAIEVNIRIIRIFTRMRQLILTHKDILLKLEQIEKTLIEHNVNLKKHDEEIQLIFKYLKELLNPPQQRWKRIKGYKHSDEAQPQSS
jgi:hypothetical protein